MLPAPDGGYPGFNTAEGDQALANIDLNDGVANTAVGANALLRFRHGADNTAVGKDALMTIVGTSTQGIYGNTAVGSGALPSTTGGNNIGIGNFAGVSLGAGSNNIYIGWVGPFSPFSESGVIRIGEGQTVTYIAGIRGASVANNLPVVIGTDGKLGHCHCG